MALPIKICAQSPTIAPDVSYVTNQLAVWQTVVSDCTSSGTGTQTAAVLAQPYNVSNAYIIPCEIIAGQNIRIRAAMAVGTTAVATSPVVRVFGADQVPNVDGTWPTGTIFDRLDASTDTATGATVTLTVTANAAQKDATFAYSNSLPSSGVGYPTKGSRGLLVLVETAASVSGGANTVVKIMAQIL